MLLGKTQFQSGFDEKKLKRERAVIVKALFLGNVLKGLATENQPVSVTLTLDRSTEPQYRGKINGEQELVIDPDIFVFFEKASAVLKAKGFSMEYVIQGENILVEFNKIKE